MRVARKAGEPRPIINGLQLVADFLNAVGPGKTRPDWKAFLKQYRQHRGVAIGLFFSWRTDWKKKCVRAVPTVDLEEATRVRSLIASDLHYLRFDNEGIITKEHPLGPLLLRLNERLQNERPQHEQPQYGSWQCYALGNAKPRPGQAILTIRRNGLQERYAVQFEPYPYTDTVEDSLYAILGRALLTGTLGRLRICRACGKYLVVNDMKRGVCPPCKDNFYNRTRPANYWKERREGIKSRKIERAKALARQGVSIETIQKETGLSERVVENLLSTNNEPRASLTETSIQMNCGVELRPPPRSERRKPMNPPTPFAILPRHDHRPPVTVPDTVPSEKGHG